MKLAIRRAAAADADRIAPLFDAYRRFYGQESDRARAEQFIAARLAHGEAIVLLAELGDEAVGFTLLYPFWSSVATGRVLVLNDLFVSGAARRHGVATSLLDAAVAVGRELGALRLVLETAPDNLAAQALYREHGWTQESSLWFRLPLTSATPIAIGDTA